MPEKNFAKMIIREAELAVERARVAEEEARLAYNLLPPNQITPDPALKSKYGEKIKFIIGDENDPNNPSNPGEDEPQDTKR